MKPLPPKLRLAFLYTYFVFSFFVTTNTNFEVALGPNCSPRSCHRSSISSHSVGRHPSVSLAPASTAKNSRGDAVEQDAQPAGFPAFVLVSLAWAEACPPPSSLLVLLHSLGEFVRFNFSAQVCCGLAYACFSCIPQYRQNLC